MTERHLEQFSQFIISFIKFNTPASSKKLSAIAGILIASLPVVALARSHVEKFTRMPQVEPMRNSQTIGLLEGYLNTNPASVGGAIISIADDTTLEADGDTSSVFIDSGKSGTGEISVYTVRKGDTLSGIAEMYGVSTNTIIWANDIRGTSIREGQELVILPISGVRHVVKSGDTLSSISSKYKADFDDILSYNGLTSASKIKVGDVIIVPGGHVSTSAVASKPSSVKSAVNEIVGYFMRPISGGRKSQGVHGYNAVDLAAPVGTSIVASADGKVIISRSGGYNGGYGTYVVVSHPNGTQTLYAHMKDNYAPVGTQVKKGQVIGTIGMTGRTTGPHIHFEVRGAKNPF